MKINEFGITHAYPGKIPQQLSVIHPQKQQKTKERSDYKGENPGSPLQLI